MFARVHTHAHHAWDTPRGDTFVDPVFAPTEPWSGEVYGKIDSLSSCAEGGVVIDEWVDDWGRSVAEGCVGSVFQHPRTGPCDEVRPGRTINTEWLPSKNPRVVCVRCFLQHCEVTKWPGVEDEACTHVLMTYIVYRVIYSHNVLHNKMQSSHTNIA